MQKRVYNKEYFRKYYLRNRIKILHRVKLKYQEDPSKHLKYLREWKKTKEGKRSIAQDVKNQRLKFPERKKAYSKLDWAVRSGKIKKEPCIKCGDPNSQGHHEDYSKPYEVIWLCDLHHKEWENKLVSDKMSDT